MKITTHRADTRGYADHGWLKSYHTFSFANYHHPDRNQFGVLRVLNDDTVAAGKGFDTHPHHNMEIITIPLYGDLEHQDSMGNKEVIKQGDVQVMSAGAGIFHSEYNKNNDQEVQLLQIWVFPRKKGVEPRYDQISLKDVHRPNEFYQILSPNQDDQGVWIHQDAWFHMGSFDQEKQLTYTFNRKGNGLYVFVIEGQVGFGDTELKRRDAAGITNAEELMFTVNKGSQVLLMEIPMTQ